MGLWTLVACFVLCIIVAHRGALTYFRTRAARVQIAEAQGYAHLGDDHTRTLLVLGDSTGVGVGAAMPEESVAGRIALRIGATYVENRAKSGACVDDLKEQIETAQLRRYDTILIQIGGNDIIMLRSAKKVAQRLDVLMMLLPEAKQVLLMSAGNVGGATIFPEFMRPFHTWTNQAFHRWFAKVAKRRNATYVNLYEPPGRDQFMQDPDRYLSEDGLHPSSEGYALWFAKAEPYLI